jgi:hypothetical protein
MRECGEGILGKRCEEREKEENRRWRKRKKRMGDLRRDGRGSSLTYVLLEERRLAVKSMPLPS